MKRHEVFELIVGERMYQDTKPPRPEEDAKTPVSSWILYMFHHLEIASDHIYSLDKPGALENIRKIAALAVACMEYNETKPRGFDEATK